MASIQPSSQMDTRVSLDIECRLMDSRLISCTFLTIGASDSGPSAIVAPPAYSRGMSRDESQYAGPERSPSSWATVSGSSSWAIASLCSSRAAASSLIACDCSSNARRCRSLAAFNLRATSRAVSARSPRAATSRNDKAWITRTPRLYSEWCAIRSEGTPVIVNCDVPALSDGLASAPPCDLASSEPVQDGRRTHAEARCRRGGRNLAGHLPSVLAQR